MTRKALRPFVLYLLMAVIGAWVLAPLVLITLATFTPQLELYRWPKAFLPSRFSGETLAFFLTTEGVLRATFMSLLVGILTIGLAMAIGAPAGYATARFSFRGKDAFRLAILLTRMFPVAILAIPLAVSFIKVGLYDTPLGVAIAHTALALPIVILITTSVFLGVPKDLEEAAITLGCTRLQAFLKVVLPLALPGLAAAAMFTFVLSWNEVFAATILTVRNRTLPALVVYLLGLSPLNFRFAGGFFMVVPALVVMFMIRRYLTHLWGITIR
jgi:multiple sugar transport system permease protein